MFNKMLLPRLHLAYSEETRCAIQGCSERQYAPHEYYGGEYRWVCQYHHSLLMAMDIEALISERKSK